MSIFQPSVLKNVSQDESIIAQRWAAFQTYLSKIDFLKEVKEEKYQDGFLKDVFENCLGYTLDSTNPQNYSLEREKKNETDAKKADGVLYLNSEVIGVIELKDQKTKNLDAIEAQAFNYHNSHANSRYIIISNFDELRFYIDKKTGYEKFFLFNLDYDEFKKLHLLLSYESIKSDIPLKLKEKSANFEAKISKELYKDFSLFRTHLFENIVKNNSYIDKSALLRLTQKLCDRIIFILFAEDRGLLTPNTIKEIRHEFQNQKFTSYTLYDIYKFYFNAINEGNEKLNIPRYNGGLFAKDELLDSLRIEDAYLDVKAQKLSDYDFLSDISVNILGHIFEQSLTDLEELNASIHEIEFDKKKSKRKKDGIFYTPEYITKYIVDNTLGKLCHDKKEALKLTNITPPLNPKKPTKQEQIQKENLEEYRNWLLNLKILDPACGSGAFLNQALDFLIKEHESLQKDLVIMGDITAYYEIEKSILEHNLYGVDINEDAVEIAKLSLWLRTAHRGRELTNLSEKIKCGNSLIDDKSVAENAFVWEEEFPEVFNPPVIPAQAGIQKKGFDVVIGNPPYVNISNLPEWQRIYFQNNFVTCKNKADLYAFFVEKATKLLVMNGKISFIMPQTWTTTTSFEPLRKLLFEQYEINALLNLGHGVFEDAIVQTVIFIATKNKQFNGIPIFDKDFQALKYIPKDVITSNAAMTLNMDWSLKKQLIEDKIFQNSSKLENIVKFTRGIKTSNDSRFLSKTAKNFEYKKVLRGKNIKAYKIDYDDEYIWYRPDLMKEKVGSLPHSKELFEVPEKLITQRVNSSGQLLVAYDNEQYFCLDTTNVSVYNSNSSIKLKYLLLIMNSKLINWWFNDKFKMPTISGYELKQIPIKSISREQQEPFIQKADKMLSLNKSLQETKQNFFNELKLEKLTKKLQNFEELEFDEFVKEYTKAKKLKFADKLAERNFKQEWQSLFENDKILTCRLKDEITKTDKEIDTMVYKLYNLTEDEIRIVEGK